MSDLTIEEFCDLHKACKECREWVLAHCTSMQDAWAKLKPDWIIWIATQKGVLSDRELRLFAVWSARQVQHFMKDPRSVFALDVAEKYTNGQASAEELTAAKDAARDAAWDAVWDSARDAARDAAKDAAWDAARDAAKDAAWDAASASARAVARAEARDAARDAQAKWLRENTKPNFTKEAKP